jgi:O-antigen/teichoic acid export membrane protein
MIVILPNVVSPEQYGLIRSYFPIASLLALFYLLGIPNIILRFFPFYREKSDQHGGILFFSILVTTASILLFTTIFILNKNSILSFFEEKSILLVDNYFYALPIAFGIAYFEVLNAYCKANFKSIFPSLLNEVYVRIMVISLALIYYFDEISFPVFLTLFSSVYLTNPILLALYLKKEKLLQIKPERQIFQKSSINSLANYGVFNFFGGATGALIDKVDVLLVTGYLGLVNSGIYSVSIMLALAVALPAKALALLLNPLVAEAYKDNDHEKLKDLYQSSSRNQFLAGCFIFIMIAANFQSFFSLVKPTFLVAFIPFVIIGLARVFDMVTGINGMLIVTSKFFRYDLIFSVLLLAITILNNWLLIPKYGMNGAALATFIALFIYNIAKFIFVEIKLKMRPFTWDTAKVLIFGLLVSALVFLLPHIVNPWVDILFRTTIVGFSYVAGIVFFKLTPESHEMAIVILRRFNLK